MCPTVSAPSRPDWQQIDVETTDLAGAEAALRETLAELGYRPYDPFPGGIGTPPGLKDFARSFLAPPNAGWLGLVMGVCASDVRDALLSALEPFGAVVYAWIEGANGDMACFSHGALDTGALSALLRPGAAPEDIQRVRLQKVDAAPPRTNALPAEIEALARSRSVDPAQASRLMDRLTGSLFGKLDRQSGGEASAARSQAHALLQSQKNGGPDWSSPAGRRLDALAALLTFPLGWREPGFEALRDAYHVARRLQRNPRASLLPDEREAQARVPNAMEYTPLYYGK